jgi:murein tripeptide amidase MpaA
MDFNHYFTNEELESILKRWAEEYPELCSLTQIGESYEKRPIWLLILTNRSTGPDHEKPAVWIDANLHATEIAGTTTALLIAHSLLAGYGAEERFTRLLDRTTYYIVPRANPDGAYLALSDRPRYIRSGVRRYPWLEKDEGLHEEDIDGDGRIRQMRILDPNGDWKVSTLDPRLMEKRAPDEVGGTYYRILPEGRIEDFDGYLVKVARQLEGLDFNRNFPFEWRPEGDQHGAGPYPVSEPEVKALVAFITGHPNINFAVTYHTYSRVILRPYSTKPDEEMVAEDLWVYQKIGEIGSRFTGYRCVSTFHEFKYHPKDVTTGAFDDWLFDHLGVFSFTIELWDLPDEAGVKDRKFFEWYRTHPHHEDVQILKWIDEHGEEGVYSDWRPYEHPQLGKIEIGGWDLMHSWRNPPASSLGSEAASNAPFVFSLGDMLPRLQIHALDVTPVESSDYHINLVVENTGFLPTYTSRQGKNRKAVRPVIIELEIPDGAALISGKRRVELGHLEGRSSRLDVVPVWEAGSTENRGKVEWVIRVSSGVEIPLKILSERAGVILNKIKLG